jgi:hypothetical protein
VSYKQKIFCFDHGDLIRCFSDTIVFSFSGIPGSFELNEIYTEPTGFIYQNLDNLSLLFGLSNHPNVAWYQSLQNELPTPGNA